MIAEGVEGPLEIHSVNLLVHTLEMLTSVWRRRLVLVGAGEHVLWQMADGVVSFLKKFKKKNAP